MLQSTASLPETSGNGSLLKLSGFKAAHHRNLGLALWEAASSVSYVLQALLAMMEATYERVFFGGN
jgi:hypothetical protein